jgi:hypothetical protein
MMKSDQLDLIAERIRTATGLWELREALIEFETSGTAEITDEFDRDFDSENALKARGIDICELPIFGGPEPRSTAEVWSWDDDCILTGVGPFADWEIRDRNDGE